MVTETHPSAGSGPWLQAAGAPRHKRLGHPPKYCKIEGAVRDSNHASSQLKENLIAMNIISFCRAATPLVICVFLLISCTSKYLKDTSGEFTVTYLDGLFFDHYVIRLNSSTDSVYVLLSPKKPAEDSAYLIDNLVELEEGKSYRITLEKFETKPALVLEVRSRLSFIDKYYIHHENYDKPSDTGILFWNEGQIVVDVYYSNNIIGKYLKSPNIEP